MAATRDLRPVGGVDGSSGTAASSACILMTLTGAYWRRCEGRNGLRCCSATPKPDAVARRQETNVHLSMVAILDQMSFSLSSVNSVIKSERRYRHVAVR